MFGPLFFIPLAASAEQAAKLQAEMATRKRPPAPKTVSLVECDRCGLYHEPGRCVPEIEVKP